MASTVALFSGLSGLSANARNLDVIGNNIANVNTTAYKSNRLLFASQFSRNLSLGSVPGDTTGGSNPAQIGLGVTVAGTQRNFGTGSLSTTGDSRDLAVEGDGFFIVRRGDEQLYTRAGSFRQNSLNDLVTITGERVLGFGVDENFDVVSGTLVPLNLPVGELRLAEATEDVRFTGNLNSGGELATRGARINLGALTDLAAAPVALTTLLTDVDNPAVTGTQALFSVGQFFQVQGAEKGGKELPTANLEVEATTTVQDLINFLNAALGLEPAAGADPAGFTPGVSLDAATGVLTIVGNRGSVNDLSLDSTNLRVLTATGTLAGTPLSTTKVASSDGESVRTTFVAYDSLGAGVNVDLTLVLDSRDSLGSTWRYFIESGDDTDVNLQVGTGTVRFDTSGRLVPPEQPITATIDRTGVGAVDPMSFTVSFASPSGTVTGLVDVRSTLAATFQDGTPIGVLSSFSVGANGIITGAFTNGLTRTIGQVALSTFANPEGLVDIGSNLFTVGPNSGTPIVTTPTALGTGRVVGGTLELSNVDLAQEFINLIQASTGYSASSRIITTTDQLIQQLLALGR